MLQPAAFSKRNVRANDTVGADDGLLANFRTRVDNRRRVNLRPAHLSMKANINSPSETTVSLTTQWQRAFASLFPRFLMISA
jgi:hypothetical protein